MALTKKQDKKLSVTLCYYLRHDPEKLGIKLNKEGWTHVDEFVKQFNVVEQNQLQKLGIDVFTKADLEEIVINDRKINKDRKDRKDRYDLTQDSGMIRCKQGHSYKGVDIKYERIELENDVYHGTSSAFLDSIMEQGILPKTRLYVHLSKDIKTAQNVGNRHVKDNHKLVVLKISKDAPIDFFITGNGVIHAMEVPPKYITILDS